MLFSYGYIMCTSILFTLSILSPSYQFDFFSGFLYLPQILLSYFVFSSLLHSAVYLNSLGLHSAIYFHPL
jgi:hypothetical protein